MYSMTMQTDVDRQGYFRTEPQKFAVSRFAFTCCLHMQWNDSLTDTWDSSWEYNHTEVYETD